MLTALTNGRVLTDRGIVEGLSVVIENGRIAALAQKSDVPTSAKSRDLGGQLLLPGFIDVQVNGGGGVLFGDAPTIETIRTIASAHAQFGTTGFLPTLISGELGTIRAAIAAVEAAIDAGVPGVLGIHIEGPFLSYERKGIHDPSKFRTLDDEAFKLLTSVRRGKTLVTLAPEETTPAMIRALAGAGVIVSAGHTNATYDEIQPALKNGLTGFTHLFNAMSPLRAREPGAVGAALDDRDSWCGVIVDGRHVAPAVLRVALRCKRHDRVMFITDAMPSVGSRDKSFVLEGRKITVRDGVCIAPDGTLAGSDLDMASAIRNAVAMLGLGIEEASAMTSLNAANFLGLGGELGRIAPGYRANLVLLDAAFGVSEVWTDGSAHREP